MSICMLISANQLETVASKVDNENFKYKFLYDSDDKYKTIEEYKLNLLDDCLMFSGIASQLRTARMKVAGPEAERKWNEIVDAIFDEDRHVAVVNDYFDSPNMVLVVPITINDPTQRAANNMTLSDYQLEYVINRLRYNFSFKEGMNMVTWDEYNMDMFEDRDPNKNIFKMTQQRIKETARASYKRDLYSTFMEAYKFRMITYYTKLRSYGLDEIMRKLSELGYLDERFNNELYLYEEEARRLLAKRLCAISFKDDIRLLIDEGIIKPESITYNLDV